MTDRLEGLGWDPARAQEWLDLDLPDAMPGRVTRVDRGECTVSTRDHGDLRAASDSQRSQDLLAPVTGDWVSVTEDPELGVVVDAVLERRTAIVRRDPSEQVVEQVLVANIDVVAVVHGLDRPISAGRLERFLVLALDSGADPLVLLTKTDLVDERDLDRLVAEAEVADVPIIATSTTTHRGLDEVRAHVGRGRSMVLIGPSGVGKSTLVNALVGDDVQEIGDVRAGDAKGRHTTTRRELIEMPGGGVLVDTPGVRAVGLWAADVALDQVFADVAAVALECRFRDCTHRSEPDCAVNAAIAAGELDAGRVERFQRMWEEIAEQSDQAENRARAANQGRRRRHQRRRRR